MYVFQIFDYFSASGIILLTICFFESIVLGWIYGADRFYDNVYMMLGRKLSPYFKICWKFITPLMTLVSIIIIILNFYKLYCGGGVMFQFLEIC